MRNLPVKKIALIIPVFVFLIAVSLATADETYERNYTFDGSMSREVLDNYLSRSITMSSLLRGIGDPDDNVRMLTETGVKFVGRAILMWGGETNLDSMIETARPIVKKLHAIDPEIIIQACEFEIVTKKVDDVPIPADIFEEFGLKPEKRNFRYDDMMYPEGAWQIDHWNPDSSVPDMSRLETRMWFVFLAKRYIDVGVEAIHFGQVAIMDDRDPEHHHWADMMAKVRSYAKKNARRHFVLCDAHTGRGTFEYDGVLMFDFHSFPLRIEEVVEKPHQGVLMMGYLDSIFGFSAGGVTPSGWSCESLPYLVELDNFGRSGRAGENIGTHYIWGYDEISWFSHKPEDERDLWLHYAWNWVRSHDPNGWLQMPGSRPIWPPINEGRWYWANDPSDKCPEGFGQEGTIKRIWEQHTLEEQRVK